MWPPTERYRKRPHDFSYGDHSPTMNTTQATQGTTLLQGGAPKIAKLAKLGNITPITMVFYTYN